MALFRVEHEIDRGFHRFRVEGLAVMELDPFRSRISQVRLSSNLLGFSQLGNDLHVPVPEKRAHRKDAAALGWWWHPW